MWRAYRWPSLAARLRPGPAGVSPPGVRLGSESLFGFGRNGCSASLGIGVRLQSERPLGFGRNLHLTKFGTPMEIVGQFGGKEAYTKAVRDLEDLLYRTGS